MPYHRHDMSAPTKVCEIVSGFASNIYFPAIPTIATDLSVSVELVNLSVTCYLVFQAIAPSLWGPLSDVKGRRTAYLCTFVLFLGACIGLAQTKNYATLIVLRCLQSAGSASTVAIGSGVMGDITTRAERGGFMGIFQAGLLVPVAVGPIVGGALAESLGWRTIFWFLTIYGGVFLILLFLLLPETLRSIVGNGSEVPSNNLTRYPLLFFVKSSGTPARPQDSMRSKSQKHLDIGGPFRILFSKQAAPIIIFLAIHYTVWQMSITAMSTLFESHYSLSESKIGLTYIANGAGSIIGTLIMGKLLDIDYRRVKTKYLAQSAEASSSNSSHRSSSSTMDSHFPLEEARLRLIPILSLLQCMSILLFGWTIEYPKQVHIAIPIISTFFSGWTAIGTQSVVTTYLVDVFPDRSAAASASLNLARCLLAACGTSAVNPMVNAIGVGCAFTICTGAQFLALTGVVVQRKQGGKWRTEAEEKKERRMTAE